MDLKLLLKRGALVAAANWQVVAIQFAAQLTFRVLVAVPLVGAAVLVAVMLGADLAILLQGGVREMFAAIANALLAEPAALVAFVIAFAVVLLGGSVFMFLVKGGTVTVVLAAVAEARAIEREPLTFDLVRSASAFTIERFTSGCARLFHPYVALGLALMVVYAASAGAYLAFVVVGYRAAESQALVLGWTVIAAVAGIGLVLWITAVNFVYLLLQIALASDAPTLGLAFRSVARFIRAESRELGGVFLVVLMVVVGTTMASALVWSGVGLIAFVPLVGLAVFPLQIAALLLRGIVFEFIGLSALGAYATLYRRSANAVDRSAARERFGRDALGTSSA